MHGLEPRKDLSAVLILRFRLRQQEGEQILTRDSFFERAIALKHLTRQTDSRIMITHTGSCAEGPQVDTRLRLLINLSSFILLV